MSGRYRTGLIAAFIVQVLLLGWIIADRALLIENGREIRLAVIPIDPRDLFLGDYVTLSYGISRVHAGSVAGENYFYEGDTVYVTIGEADGDFAATALTREPPADGLYLRGIVERVADVTPEEGSDCTDTVGGCYGYDIAYNLERFYVPEGTGRELEDLTRGERVSVDVAVAADGRAALKRLLVDGEVRHEESLL